MKINNTINLHRHSSPTSFSACNISQVCRNFLHVLKRCFDFFFSSHFTSNWCFLISEWFPTVGQHSRVQEAVISAKYFTTKWKVLIKIAQCIRKYNMITLLWLLRYDPKRDRGDKLQLYSSKSFCDVKTSLSIINKKETSFERDVDFRLQVQNMLFTVYITLVIATRWW